MDQDVRTRQRLLETASKLFSQRGFNNVTVREICAEARANVAAVNYHFGDKFGLYREVVRTAIDALRGTSAAAMEAGFGGSAEDKLRAYVRVFLDDGVLKPGQQITQRFVFSGVRGRRSPTYRLQLLSGQGTP